MKLGLDLSPIDCREILLLWPLFLGSGLQRPWNDPALNGERGWRSPPSCGFPWASSPTESGWDRGSGQRVVRVWGGGQSSQLTVALNPGGRQKEGPWGGRVGAVAIPPRFQREGATDGGRDYLPWSELLLQRPKIP